ncbi:LytR/AlgR family response regulator transcription factor [Gilvibacter sp.]|uniref:LytR/AlgR family response regulator transcription factor n=1 Tax=Gilvibacter sp. TaxID=2729997 RepID=UPI003F4A42B6
MTNYRFYRYLFIGWVVFFGLLTVFGVPYAVKKQTVFALEERIANAKTKADQLAVLASALYGNDQQNSTASAYMQSGVEASSQDAIELVVIDWSGKVIAHPAIVELGNQYEALEEANIASDFQAEAFLASAEDESAANQTHKVIYLKDVPNTDLVVVAQAKLAAVHDLRTQLASVWYSGLILTGVFVLLLALWGVRSVQMYYDKKYQHQLERYQTGMLNIQQLNSSLETYKRKVEELDRPIGPVEKVEIPSEENTTKERLLTYVRNELLPVSVLDIAYIYVENTITYVVAKNGKRSTSNDSLDQIFKNLDTRLFFRANRQIIVSIGAIETILKYGNSQLKIQCDPPSEVDILIGKNKAAQFKNWLNL